MICTKKAQRDEINLGIRGDLEYWQKRTGRSLQLNTTHLHGYVSNFEDHAKGDAADIYAFREMLGLIGKSYIGERMFAVISSHKNTFSLEDWLIY